MNLTEKINIDLKDAMKAGDKIKLETIRSIRAAILEFEKSGNDFVLSPEIELQILTSAAKKRKESIEQFRNANREELAVKEESELKVIESYLPKQLSETEILDYVKKIVSDTESSSMSDFPKVMPLAIKQMKGQADGKAIKSIVQKVLSGT